MTKMQQAVALALSWSAFGAALAQPIDPPPPGSPAFCLFELPPDGDKRVWINLGIVQYVELHAGELRLSYGGGNLGSGHELRLPLASRDDGLGFMRRMRDTAAACTGVAPRGG